VVCGSSAAQLGGVNPNNKIALLKVSVKTFAKRN